MQLLIYIVCEYLNRGDNVNRLALRIPVVLLISLIFVSGCFGSPAEFEVISLQVEEPVVANEAFDVIAEVINKGGREGIYTAVLKIDGTEINIKDIKIPSGNVQEVLFTVTLEEPATRTLEVGSSSTTIKVLNPAELSISNLKVSPTVVLPGEEVTVTATARNIGGVKSPLTAILYVNGEERDRQSLSIEPGDIEVISFPLKTILPGNFEIDISGNRLSTVSVRVFDVETYYNTQHNFSILYPTGWKIQEYPDKVVIQKTNQTKLTIDINAVPAGKNLEDLYWSNIGALTPKSLESKLAWIETMGVTSKDSEALRYRTNFIYRDSSGEKYRRNLVFFKIGTNFYILMLDVLYSDYSAGNVGFYDTCVNSFKSPGATGDKV
jgi:hypothetical protein